MSAQVSRASAPPWQVRGWQEGDLPAVMHIEREIYPFPWTAGNFTDSLAAGYDAWIVELDRVLIGYAVLMWVTDEVHLLNLSVAARSQGRGIGRGLLQWLCRQAGERGARSMFLEVRPSNGPAVSLYRSSRFETVGVRRRYYPSFNDTREDALVMRRELSIHLFSDPAAPGAAIA